MRTIGDSEFSAQIHHWKIAPPDRRDTDDPFLRTVKRNQIVQRQQSAHARGIHGEVVAGDAKGDELLHGSLIGRSMHSNRRRTRPLLLRLLRFEARESSSA